PPAPPLPRDPQLQQPHRRFRPPVHAPFAPPRPRRCRPLPPSAPGLRRRACRRGPPARSRRGARPGAGGQGGQEGGSGQEGGGGESRPVNRLADQTSPYLRQHQDNPVDWYPWGEEAFGRAILEDKPILLSIGYSACHWCHVMAHESFEDPDTAKMMNDLFVCVKVDREERPDVDAIYMEAVLAMSGNGGWPMT